jgi:putative transposase
LISKPARRFAAAAGDNAMRTDITLEDSQHLLGSDWSSKLEADLRGTVRSFIEGLLREELEAVLGRGHYVRSLKIAPPASAATAEGLGNGEPATVLRAKGHRHGSRERTLTGTFGTVTVAVPRARIEADGGTTEWVNRTLPAYLRRTREIDALIAGAYLAGTNTRRVGRALGALFKGAMSKSTVSRVWRKVKADWESWKMRDLAGEDIVRLILDGTVVKVRLDRKATAISLLVVLGVRRDGQKVLLAVANMGGESEAAWRKVLDDLTKRGLRTPELAIVDGAPGLEKALVSLWNDLPIQRCTVHKLRNLIAHAPKKLADEIAADYSDMIYAADAKTVEKRRKAFLAKWRGKCEAVATSLEEAGDRLFTFTRLPVAQWKSVRTTNAIERLHLEFKRRIKTQCVLPSAETAAMLFWALLAAGQIVLRKVDGWTSLAEPISQPIDLTA